VLQDKDKWRGSISIDGVENRLGVWNTREATVQAISSFEKGRLALVDRMGAVLEEDIRDYKFSGKDLLLLTFNQLKVGILKLFSAEQVAEHKPHLKDLARRVIGSF
jgi:hypothetical protein